MKFLFWMLVMKYVVVGGILFLVFYFRPQLERFAQLLVAATFFSAASDGWERAYGGKSVWTQELARTLWVVAATGLAVAIGITLVAADLAMWVGERGWNWLLTKLRRAHSIIPGSLK